MSAASGFYDSAATLRLRWRLLLLIVLLVAAYFLSNSLSGIMGMPQVGNRPGAVERLYGAWAPVIWAAWNTMLTVLSIGLLAWPFQWLFPAARLQKQPKFLSYEFWLDLQYALQGIWLGLASFFVAVSWLITTIFGNSAGWIPALEQLPFWAQVLLAIWAFDFAVYWRHRFEHTFAPLWAFHAVHHTTERVDFLTTIRLHPFELALGALVNTLVIRMGFDPAATSLGFAIYLKYNYFVHTNVRLRFPGFLKYILVSPFMHHWHHAKDMAASGKNVGVVFAWNDFLFGTAYHPEHWPEAYGFTAPKAEQVGQSYLRHLFYPLQFLVAKLSDAWTRRSAAIPPPASSE